MAPHSSVLAWRIPGTGKPGGLPSMGSSKPMGCSRSSFKKEVYSNTILPQETRKTLNRLTLHVKQEEKEEQKHPKISRRKEIIKI